MEINDIYKKCLIRRKTRYHYTCAQVHFSSCRVVGCRHRLAYLHVTKIS